MGRSNFGGKGQPIAKYRVTLPWTLKNGRTDRDAIWIMEAYIIRWGPDTPCKGAIIRGKDMPGHARRLCHELCKNGWTNRFAVWVVDSGGLKEAQVQSYSPGGAKVPSWEGSLLLPCEYDWTVHLRQRCGLMSNYFDHLLLLLLSISNNVLTWSAVTDNTKLHWHH